MHHVRGEAGAGPAHDGMLVEAVVLGALLFATWRALCTTRACRQASRCEPAPAPVTTWEGEGGRPLPAEASKRA